MSRARWRSMDRATALETVTEATHSRRLDRGTATIALDVLVRAAPGDDVDSAVLAFGDAVLTGAFEGTPHAGLLEQCIAVLSRSQLRAALPLYRRAVALHPLPRDTAAGLRAAAVTALFALEPEEARMQAAMLVGEPAPGRTNSGQPAAAAIAVLGALGDDAALLVACRTAVAGDVPLMIAALTNLSPQVPAAVFWSLAEPLVGDRFGDAVLAFTDLVATGRRTHLLPGLGEAMVHVSDPDLMRAVLLSLTTARLEGLEPVFARLVDRAHRRALEAVADALELTRIPSQQVLLSRLQDRLRQPPPPSRSPSGEEALPDGSARADDHAAPAGPPEGGEDSVR